LPRTVGINKKPLPNARLISNKIHNAVGLNVDRSQNLTLHAMGFGQFLDHDLTLTPLISGKCSSIVWCVLNKINKINADIFWRIFYFELSGLDRCMSA
jgi:hypothetical protein